MNNKKGYLISVLAIIIVIFMTISGVSADLFNRDKEEIVNGFELDTLFLKVAVEQNKTSISNIKIKNLDEHIESCEISVNEIDELVILENNTFNLAPGETKDIEIVFNSNKEPGVYAGELVFSSPCKTQKIPIILEIQSKIVIFDANLNLYPVGEKIVPGKRLSLNVKIYDLINIGKHSIDIDYFVKSFDGLIVRSETENRIIDNDGKLEYSKTLELPKDLELGNYVLGMVIRYTDIIGTESIGTASVFFNVVEEEEDTWSEFSDNIIMFIIFMFGFFFLIFLGLFIYSMFYKDRLVIELQKQYRRELKVQRELIELQKRKGYTRLKTSAEKRVYRKEVEKVKKNRINAIKSIHKNRMKYFHKIKRKHTRGQLKNQLNKWKKQGYKTGSLEQKFKMPEAGDIKKKISKWKKQGYDTKVLDEKLKK